jgi:hypothetical protein
MVRLDWKTADVLSTPPSPPRPWTLKAWFREEGAWWLSSFFVHGVLFTVLMLLHTRGPSQFLDDAPLVDESPPEGLVAVPEFQRFETIAAPLVPGDLNLDTVALTKPLSNSTLDRIATSEGGGRPMKATGPQLGGLGGFTTMAQGPGPAGQGQGGVGSGVGTGINPGAGGAGFGFGGRSGAMRNILAGGGGATKPTERAVGAALGWLARHQMKDGSWSLNAYTTRCKDQSCRGAGRMRSNTGATALALLPFLAAGQTHQTRGPYRGVVNNGLYWLVRNQKPDGDLSGGLAVEDRHAIYAHALATITLCEVYGLSADRSISSPAQRAVNFIQAWQSPRTGGWRYLPQTDGDTSVTGWCVMALKSAKMAGLVVNPGAFEGAKRFLATVARGKYNGLSSYTPAAEHGSFGEENATMTSVALLLYQYMEIPPRHPMMIEGVKYLLQNPPKLEESDIYYWYYATQVMHNLPGRDWDAWNRQMRRLLLQTQVQQGCATGSWDPFVPAGVALVKTGARLGIMTAADEHKLMTAAETQLGGRLYVTSLAALTLEVYYRYLPLYKLDPQSPVPDSLLEELAREKAAAEEKGATADGKTAVAGEKTGAAEAKKAVVGEKADAAEAKKAVVGEKADAEPKKKTAADEKESPQQKK